MLINFFKITFRNFWKNRGYSFLNIFGLAIGVACAGLIFLWVEDERSYDQWIPGKDNLYYIQTNQTYEGKVRTFSSTPVPLAPAISREVPGIAAACRVENKQSLFNVGDKAIYEQGVYADSTIFNLFSLPFIEGRAQDALKDPTSIVITEKVARQFFGTNEAVGKVLRMNNKDEYRVSGVIRDIPENSTMRLDWIVSFQVFYALHRQDYSMDSWGNNSTGTYVQLVPAVNPATIQRSLYDFVQKKDAGAAAHCLLFSANDWHLRNHFEDGKQVGGQIEYVRLFTVIAWVVLLIACINFMNLATARSERRAREVGVRKVLGAERKELIAQFIGEAMLLSVIAVVAGVMLIALVMPAFSLLIGKTLSLGLDQPMHLATLAFIAVTCGLVAGSYPALYLSSFNPIFVFKGIRMKGSGAAIIRKGLVVTQFTVSIVLIISTLIIYRQVEHIRSRDLGYDRYNLVTTVVRGDVAKHFAQIRQDLLNTGAIENAALNSYNTLYGGNNGSGAKWAGKDPSQDILISYRNVTPGFIATAGMQMKEGRDFQLANPDADSMHIMVTETLAHMMGKGSAIGKKVWWDNNPPLTVVGVVKDFVFGDMYGKPEPVIFFNSTDGAYLLYAKIRKGVQPEAAVKKMEAVMRKNNPGYPFDYSFVNDDFNGLFRSEVLVGQLSRLFAGLAILISCLGLFGLSAYTAERRVREIGIRKVLGASVPNLAGLLSREFLQLVLLSAVVAFPLAWLMMSQWLAQFAYRVGMEWWIFALAGIAAVLIAVVTVSWQSMRAALMNPVKSLRSE